MSSVLARAVVVLEGDADDLNKMLSAAEQRMVKTGERMQDIGKTLTTRVTLPLAAMGAIALKAFGDQEDAIARTTAVLKASGNAAGITASHLEQLAATLQQTTRFSDDQAQAAMAVLLTFQGIRNQGDGVNAIFDRTATVAADLASLLGTDLQSAMLQVGKAMEDPETGLTMLRRAGVIFSDQVVEQIKELHEQGRTFEAQKIILDGLESRMKGVAQAMANTPTGQFIQAWNAVNDALEDVGKVIAGVLVPLSQFVKRAAESFKGWSDEAKRTVVIIGAIVAAVGPALVVIGTLIKMGAILSAVLGGFALPVALAVAAFGALIAAGLTVAENWLWLKQQAVALGAFIVSGFFDVMIAVRKLLRDMDLAVSGWFARLANATNSEAIARIALAASEAFGQSADEGAAAIKGLQRAQESALGSLGGTLATIERQMDEAAAGIVASGKKVEGVQIVPPAPPPGWLKPAQEAIKEFSATLRQAADMEKLLGDGFDLTAEQAKAYESVVQRLIEAGADFDAKIGPNGETLRELANRMLALRTEIDATERAQERFNEQMSLAEQAVEAALTPQQIYQQTMDALNLAFLKGRINLEQYMAAVKKAEETMKEATETSDELKQAIHDIAGRAVDDFVDFAFGAEKSFKDFVRSALAELAKLILKIQLMRLLFGKDGSGGLLGGFFADGGYLQPGQLGVVGESGPELVAGGRHGMTITPIPAMAADGGGGGGNVTVNLNVAAIDQRGVAAFFEENQGLVAATVMKGMQKSELMRRGGR